MLTNEEHFKVLIYSKIDWLLEIFLMEFRPIKSVISMEIVDFFLGGD